MPTYQYACTACAHRFEAVQSFTDDALTECPQCSGRLRKVFNSVGVVFKGSGFYRTDSRTTKGDGDGGGAGEGERKDSTGAKEKKDSKEPVAAKSTDGLAATKQPATTGATSSSSTGGTSST